MNEIGLQTLFTAACRAQAQGAYAEAASHYRQILMVAPGHGDTLNNLALALEGLNRPDEAVQCWSEALASGAGDAVQLRLGRVRTLVRQERRALALQDLRVLAQEVLGRDQRMEVLGLLMQIEAYVDAVDLCHEMLRESPDDLDILCVYATICNEMGAHAEAEAIARSILAITPDDGRAWLVLGHACYKQDRLAEAGECYRQCVEIDPEAWEGWGALGMLGLTEMRLEDSLSCFDRALTLRPGHALLRYNRSLALLGMGRYSEGFGEYEARFASGVVAPVSGLMPTAQWSGSDICGKKILVLAEQGLGDNLQFIRFASRLATLGAEVIVRTRAPLVRLFWSVPGVSQVVNETEALPGFDEFVYVMSQPRGLGLTLEDVGAGMPYLFPPVDAVNAWEMHLSGLTGLRVGLVWSGSRPRNLGASRYFCERRNLEIAQLLPVLEVAGCSFVSLQTGDAAHVLSGLPGHVSVLNCAANLKDFADTAALIANLDLVISVDTAVAHLAGGMGVPVWLLNRFDSDWRWLTGRDDSPWYPSLRQFRQRQMGVWDEVVERVAFALLTLLKSR